jgi:hypothetical protein
MGAVKYTCSGPRVLDAEGQPTMQRQGCGKDLTALIESVPVDSQDHVVECPCKHKLSISVKRVPLEDVQKATEELEI